MKVVKYFARIKNPDTGWRGTPQEFGSPEDVGRYFSELAKLVTKGRFVNGCKVTLWTEEKEVAE